MLIIFSLCSCLSAELEFVQIIIIIVVMTVMVVVIICLLNHYRLSAWAFLTRHSQARRREDGMQPVSVRLQMFLSDVNVPLHVFVCVYGVAAGVLRLKPSGCRVPVVPFDRHMCDFLTVLNRARAHLWVFAAALVNPRPCTSLRWFTACS